MPTLSMRIAVGLLALFVSISAPPVGLGQTPFRNAPPEVEEALKARVKEFYSLFQQGKYRQAEALVAEESRDAFYGMNKARNMGFQIKNVEFAADLKSAEALVALLMVMPMMGKEPLPFPVLTRWKLIDGDWYIHFPNYKPGDIVKTPFGDKTVEEPDSTGYVFPENEDRPNQRSVRRMYEVSEQELRFPSSSAGPVTRSITVRNLSEGRLAVRRASNRLKGLDVKIEPAEVEPNEEITISFTYQPAVNQLQKKYRSRFSVSPLSQRFTVNLMFEESVVEYESTTGKVDVDDLEISDQGKQTLDVTGLTPGQLYSIAARGHSLPGGEGRLFLGVNDGSGRRGSSDGPRMVPHGESSFFGVDFAPSKAGRVRIHFGYDGGPGRARWSELTITPRTVADLEIPNGDFESVFLRPWQQWGQSKAELSSEPVRSGRNSVKLSGSSGAVYQDVAGVSPGRRYEVKAWVRAEAGTEGRAGLDAHDGYKKGAVSSERKQASESLFEPLTVEFVGTGSGQVRVHLVYSGGPGAVYFDDVVVSEKSVLNGGFEDETVAPWEVYGDADVKIENEVSASGRHSLAASGSQGGISQTLTGLRPGAAYRLTAWARSAADIEGEGLVRILGGEAGDQNVSRQEGPKAVPDSFFLPFSVDFSADPSGSARVQLESSGEAGAIYWDDVTVTQQPD